MILGAYLHPRRRDGRDYKPSLLESKERRERSMDIFILAVLMLVGMLLLTLALALCAQSLHHMRKAIAALLKVTDLQQEQLARLRQELAPQSRKT